MTTDTKTTTPATTFDMKVRIPVRVLGPLTELVIGAEGRVISIEETPTETKTKTNSGRHYGIPRAHIHRGKETGQELLTRLLAGGHEWTRDKIKAAFAKEGFQPQSYSPAVSLAKSAGLIKEVRNGVFRVAPRDGKA